MRQTSGPRTLLMLVWVVLVLPLGGCSREEPATRGSADDGAEAGGCELLTDAEIQEVTGLAPARSEEGTQRLRDCDWYLPDDRPLVGLVVGAAPRSYEEYLQSMREQLGSDLKGLDMSRVEGVGNYAVWHGEYLNVAAGGDLLVVWIFAEPAGGKPKREAAIELARKAVPRL